MAKKIIKLERVQDPSSNMDALEVHFEPERTMIREGKEVPVPNTMFFTSYEEAMQEVEPGKPKYIKVLEEEIPKMEARDAALANARAQGTDPEQTSEVTRSDVADSKNQAFIGRSIGTTEGGKKK